MEPLRKPHRDDDRRASGDEHDLDPELENFLWEHADHRAFAACLYHDNHHQEPNLDDRSIHASDQTVVSEVTMLSANSLFRGPLYRRPTVDSDPTDQDVANLFNQGNRKPAARTTRQQGRTALQNPPPRQNETEEKYRKPAATIRQQGNSSNGMQPLPTLTETDNSEEGKGSEKKKATGKQVIAKGCSDKKNPSGVDAAEKQPAKKKKAPDPPEDSCSSTHTTSSCFTSASMPSDSNSKDTDSPTKKRDEVAVGIPAVPAPHTTPPRLRRSARGLNEAVHPGAYGLDTVHTTNPTLERTTNDNDDSDEFASSSNPNDTRTNNQIPDVECGNNGEEASSNGNSSNPIVVLDGTLEEEKPEPWQRTSYIGAIVVASLLVAIAIIIPLVVLQRSSGLSLEEQGIMEDGPPIEEKMDLPGLPSDLMISSEMALEDPQSPRQFQAYDWISKDPHWDTFEEWRQKQRFAMTCFYFAMGGVLFVESSFLGYDHHECEWMGSAACKVNAMGRVTHLSFDKFGMYIPGGAVPPEVAFLSHLESLLLDRPQFGIQLEVLLPLHTPNSFPSLKELILADSELTGPIPSTLGLLTRLTHLDLSRNKLHSSIPSELGLLSNLASLDFSGNNLSGIIPDFIGDIPHLREFNVVDNPSVQQTVPSGFCDENRQWYALQTDWCLAGKRPWLPSNHGATECCDAV